MAAAGPSTSHPFTALIDPLRKLIEGRVQYYREIEAFLSAPESKISVKEKYDEFEVGTNPRLREIYHREGVTPDLFFRSIVTHYSQSRNFFQMIQDNCLRGSMSAQDLMTLYLGLRLIRVAKLKGDKRIDDSDKFSDVNFITTVLSTIETNIPEAYQVHLNMLKMLDLELEQATGPIHVAENLTGDFNILRDEEISDKILEVALPQFHPMNRLTIHVNRGLHEKLQGVGSPVLDNAYFDAVADVLFADTLTAEQRELAEKYNHYRGYTPLSLFVSKSFKASDHLLQLAYDMSQELSSHFNKLRHICKGTSPLQDLIDMAIQAKSELDAALVKNDIKISVESAGSSAGQPDGKAKGQRGRPKGRATRSQRGRRRQPRAGSGAGAGAAAAAAAAAAEPTMPETVEPGVLLDISSIADYDETPFEYDEHSARKESAASAAAAAAGEVDDEGVQDAANQLAILHLHDSSFDRIKRKLEALVDAQSPNIRLGQLNSLIKAVGGSLKNSKSKPFQFRMSIEGTEGFFNCRDSSLQGRTAISNLAMRHVMDTFNRAGVFSKYGVEVGEILAPRAARIRLG